MSEKHNRENEVRYKQKAVVEFLMHESEKPKMIHKCLKVVYGEVVFDVSIVCYWAHEAQKTLKLLDQDRLGHLKL